VLKLSPSRRSRLAMLSLGIVALAVAACGSAGATNQPTNGPAGTPGAASATDAAPASAAPPPPTAAVAVSQSPQPTTDTSSWLPFTSSSYGFTVSHPAGWTVAPASGHWSLANPADESEDILTSPSGPPSPTGPPNLAVFELTVPSGMTADTFIKAYRAIAHVSDCYPSESQLRRTTIDGHVATIADGGCNQQYYFAEATAIISNRIWIFNLHGPDRSLISSLLSTVKIDPTKVVD
jgi:hypothetical protein